MILLQLSHPDQSRSEFFCTTINVSCPHCGPFYEGKNLPKTFFVRDRKIHTEWDVGMLHTDKDDAIYTTHIEKWRGHKKASMILVKHKRVRYQLQLFS